MGKKKGTRKKRAGKRKVVVEPEAPAEPRAPTDDELTRHAFATILEAMRAATLNTGIDGYENLRVAILRVRDFIEERTGGPL